MRNFMQEMMDVMFKEGAQATYDLGPQLLVEIEAEQERLNNQAVAIRAFGKILEDNAGVIARSTELDSNLDPIEAPERPREIISAAIDVWESQQDGWRSDSEAHLVRTHDVLERLRTKGLDLGVKQPLAVIGTVLASAEGFRKVARNTVEYTPPPPPAVEDLPW